MERPVVSFHSAAMMAAVTVPSCSSVGVLLYAEAVEFNFPAQQIPPSVPLFLFGWCILMREAFFCLLLLLTFLSYPLRRRRVKEFERIGDAQDTTRHPDQ